MSWQNSHRNYAPPHGQPGGKRVTDQDIVVGGVAAYATVLVAPVVYDFTAQFAESLIEDLYGHGAWDVFWFFHALAVVLVTYLGLNRSLKFFITIIGMTSARYGAHFADLWPMKILDFIF